MENYRSFSLYNYSTHDNILTLQRCGSKNSTDTINTFDNIPKMVVKKVLTDEAGNNFEKYYDAVGNLRREIKYVEGIPSDNPERVLIPLITDYKYDDLYRVIEVKTPNDKHIYYTYDGLGRQSSRTTPDAGEVKYKYDKNDNLRFSQDNNQANKPTDRPPARYITFRGYDGLNRLLYVCDSYNESYLPLWNSLNPDITYNFENYDIAIIRNNFLIINVYDTLTNYPANANIFSERLPADYYTSAPRNTNNTKGTLCATAYRTLGTDEWSFKYYRYDARGRVIKMWNYIAGLGEKSIEYSYNSQNQITDMRYENEEPESKKFRYAYDYAGRLLNTSFDYIPSDSPIDDYLIFSSYTYNQNSQISTSKFNPINLTYTSEYDSRSRITRFTCSKPNIFSYDLTYYANSNIQSQSFSGDYKYYFSNQYDLSFNYSYDESNRLLEANCTSNQDNTFDLINSYDPDGNILSLQRYGSNNNLFDNYNYSYYAGTNRLRIVSGGVNQFTYDYNGNMINDYMNNNTGIKYDHRNLITEITKQNLNQDPPTTYITRYRYDEAGNRTRKTIFLSNEYDPPPLPEEDTDLPPGWIIIVDDYYSRDVAGREIMVYSSYTPLYWNVWSGGEITGRINCGNGTRNYYLKDHLGSVRVVIDDGRTVVSANDYDMWGYYLENRTYESFNTKNKFTGKERDNESTYDYFGARYYDSRVGRWGQVEPLLNKYHGFSPYCYTLNNPIIFTDQTGFWIPEYDSKTNQIRVIAEKDDNLADLYNQLGISADDFAKTFDINNINDFQVEEGKTSFDITSFVTPNKNYISHESNGNCFGFCIASQIKLSNESQYNENDLFSMLNLTINTASPKTGNISTFNMADDVIDLEGYTSFKKGSPGHSAIFIIKDRSSQEYYLNRITLGKKVTLNSKEQINDFFRSYVYRNKNYFKQLPELDKNPVYYQIFNK